MNSQTEGLTDRNPLEEIGRGARPIDRAEGALESVRKVLTDRFNLAQRDSQLKWDAGAAFIEMPFPVVDSPYGSIGVSIEAGTATVAFGLETGNKLTFPTWVMKTVGLARARARECPTASHIGRSARASLRSAARTRSK